MGIAAHAEHFRALAGFFFWLFVNEPGGMSVAHAEQRTTDAMVGQVGGGLWHWFWHDFLPRLRSIIFDYTEHGNGLVKSCSHTAGVCPSRAPVQQHLGAQQA